MPIIEPIAADVPVSQGDVLKDVRLFATRDIGADQGGEPHNAKASLCLVVSRPCVSAHKPNLLVAAIERYPDGVPREVETFEDVRVFLNGIRDGINAPDWFYLGQVPTFEGRFAARLDSLHTIQWPRDEEAARQVIARKRLGRLHIDFARDLHVRLFRAFASLGFDDHGWMSTSDLRWLVSKGQAEESATEAKLRAAEAALNSARAQGFRNPNEQQQLERSVTAAREALQGLERTLGPYQAEAAARG
jgi:hypothetical protein